MEHSNFNVEENSERLAQSNLKSDHLKDASEILDAEEEKKLKDIVDNKNRKFAENAVPPNAWEDQQKAYKDAWNNNKNQQLEDDI